MDYFQNDYNSNITPYQLATNQMISYPPHISVVPFSEIIKCMNCDQLFNNTEFVQHICDYDSNKEFIVLDENIQYSNNKLIKLSTYDKDNTTNDQLIKASFNYRKKLNIKDAKNNNKTSKKRTARQYLCEICGKFFAQLFNLKLHIAFHRGEKSFHCQELNCNKKFTIRQDLNNHIRSCHTGERPYHCLVCGKRFLTGSVFYQHQLIHIGDRRYSCDKCDRRFFRKNTLKYHLKVHSGEKPYQCITCSAKFRQKSHINSHIWRKHSNLLEKPGYIIISQSNEKN